MDRRAFIAGTFAIIATPVAAAEAQPAERIRRIGVLTGLSETDPNTRSNLQALRRALQARGWRDGENLQVVYRFAAGDPERARRFAAELVGLELDLIVGHTTPVAAALHEATRTLPIVFVSITDPIADGFVTSLARPGGNVTGFTNYDFTMGGKWFEILKEIAPRTTRVMVLLNPDTGKYYTGYLGPIEASARADAVVVSVAWVRDPEQIEKAIRMFGRQPGGGVIFLPSAPITAHIRQIITSTGRHRMPAVYPFGFFAKQGGLAAYGTDLDDLFRRAAEHVDRILKGEKPADLPVQAPTKFELVVNLKTAKALGLTIPPSVLVRADEVIE